MSQTATSNIDLSKARVITAKAAAEAGLTVSAEDLKTRKCPFCGKELYQLCIAGGLAGFIATAVYQTCECPEGQAQEEQARAAKKRSEAEEKRQQAIERIRRRIERAFKQSEMPPRWRQYTFDRYETDNEITSAAKARCLNFTAWFKRAHSKGETTKRSPNGLLIVGDSGTGKTHLAAAVLNSIISDEPTIPVIGATMGEMLTKLKATYDNAGRGEDVLIRTYIEVPLLLIDDFGSEQMTEWAAERIYSIVNGRYNALMPTIVTSNYATDNELAKRLTPKGQPLAVGAKIADRLSEMCSRIELNGKSRRSGIQIGVDAHQTNRNALICDLNSADDKQ